MRFVFKTSYNQDIQIFRDRVDMGWYIVRLHRDDSVSLLSTAQGAIPSWLST